MFLLGVLLGHLHVLSYVMCEIDSWSLPVCVQRKRGESGEGPRRWTHGWEPICSELPCSSKCLSPILLQEWCWTSRQFGFRDRLNRWDIDLGGMNGTKTLSIDQSDCTFHLHHGKVHRKVGQKCMSEACIELNGSVGFGVGWGDKDWALFCWLQMKVGLRSGLTPVGGSEAHWAIVIKGFYPKMIACSGRVMSCDMSMSHGSVSWVDPGQSLAKVGAKNSQRFESSVLSKAGFQAKVSHTHSTPYVWLCEDGGIQKYLSKI